MKTTDSEYYGYLFNDLLVLKEVSGVVGGMSHYLNLGNMFGTVQQYSLKRAIVVPLPKEAPRVYKFNLYLGIDVKFGFIADTDWVTDIAAQKGVTKQTKPPAERRLTISGVKDFSHVMHIGYDKNSGFVVRIQIYNH